METVGRTLRRRMLGLELRRYREAADLSVRALAPLVKLQPGTISKIENGRQAVLPRNVLLILRACGAPEDETARLVAVAEQGEREAWWAPFKDTVPSWFRDYMDLESDASTVVTYSAELIYGLLQTPEYAEAVVRATEPDFTESQFRRSVELREARQEKFNSSNGPALHVLLGETALLRTFGSAVVMRDQMRHLVTMSEHERVTLQVVPFSAGGHPSVKGSYTILRFVAALAELDCVYLESETDGVWQDTEAAIERYASVFARTAYMAMSPEATREHLITLSR